MENINTLLYTEGSLTEALCAALGMPVQVDVLREMTRLCTPAETARLNDTQLWQRDVMLKGTAPLILARTRVALRDINQSLSPLKALGSKPLGEWLFKQENLTKLSFEVDEIKRQRDTLYQLDQAIIWVQEIFIS
jgi:chorismate-pyruvate lyase